MYSDIENPAEVDIAFKMPYSEPKSSIIENPNDDIMSVFKKAFGPQLNGSNMRTTIIDNGVIKIFLCYIAAI